MSSPSNLPTKLPRSYLKASVFMDIAKLLGELGTCDRKKVGAVIVRDGRCISWAYNGSPPGAPHCDENNHGWPVGAEGYIGQARDNLELHGCRNVTHAEANAVSFAARQGISTENTTLYVTLSPCEVCARLLIAAGIEGVVFDEAYRDPAGLDILRSAGVRVVG